MALLPGPEALRAAAARNPRPGWKAFLIDWARLGGRGARGLF
ncbi:MAG TPA: hypothetical protein VJ622_04685 [Acidimicrobiia bacterium]|nr:hypothetical protein [Acidimicrobiia bacterium]